MVNKINQETICIDCIEQFNSCQIRKAFTDIHKSFPDIMYYFVLIKCPIYKNTEEKKSEEISCKIPDGNEHACPICQYVTKERVCPECGECISCNL